MKPLIVLLALPVYLVWNLIGNLIDSFLDRLLGWVKGLFQNIKPN